ncbi:phage tail spike protein [Bacillus paramycoides]|uniref:phage tail spike protein n=1 Tax=Bacillus paramycoides TaxID=2026194 RepID=UPI002E23F6F8|nr:phage tail spike protein [Bacillus paramycoides]MED0963860.1 phage tail spike protein [Bacillus paramycoides]
MRTPSGTLHVVDFKTEQIVANIQTKDYWDDKRHWEIKNNIDTLEFRVFDNTDHAATLMQQNLVLKEVRDGRIVPYVITEAEKDSNDRSVIAYASGEWIQLAKAGIIPPQKLEGKTVIEMVNIALADTKWKTGNIEYASFRSMTIDEFIDPLSFLKKIASLFELEIQYRAEVVGSQIIGRYVDMVKKRGQETGKEVTLGKDLIGIKRVENSQNICTSLVGFVKKEGDTIITVESINNGLPYIVDSDAFQRWNERGHHKFGFYTPETEEDITPQRLMTLMKTELAKRVNTSVSYEVQAQSIGRVFGLAHELINEGDSIRIKDTGFTPKLYLEARAIAGDESFTDPSQDKYVFGDYREITDPNEELRKIYNRILGSLGNKQEMIDQLDKLVKEANETASNAKKESEAAKTLAEKVQENLKNNTVEIIEAKNPPTTGLKDRKTLWLDISNGKPGILKLRKDGIWDPVVPDVEKAKKETLEQVNKDIESTKTELNQKVQNVENKAKEIAGQIVDVQKQVNGKVDQTWINNQLKDKADKSGVYTKDEIKDGFIGKQIYETDKQGNVQKFKDVNTSIGQTNEALTQKAERSELKKTSDGLSQLEQKTNEIRTTAEGTKQQLSQLETTVKNTEISIRNLVPNSAIKQTSSDYGFGFRITTIDLVAGETYILMGNGRVDQQALDDGKYLVIYIYEPTWKHVSKNFTIKTLTDSTGYTLFTPTWTGKYTVASYLSPTGGNRLGKVTTNWVAVYKGNVPMGWSPAPEDQVSTTDFTKKTVEIESTIKGINTTVSNIQNEQGKLTERVTKSEQTTDGFKTSIESLSKKDTEISNKLNTVESTVEGTKKTISDVQQTTNDLKKTTTEIKEQAGKISEKLTSVEKNFNEQEIGVRNLVSDTKYWETTQLASNSAYGLIKNNLNQIFSELVGETVTFSFDVKITTTDKTAGRVQFYGENGSPKYTFVRQIFTGITDEFQRVTYTTKITEQPNNTGQARLEFWGIDAKTTKIIIQNFKLEKGNKATGWTPAPEDQVSIGEFTKKTTEIEKSVDGVKTTVTSVQNSQAGFEKRMTTVEQTASGLSSTVSNLNNVVSDQGKKITDANTKIEQQAQAIKAKVEIKQVEDYVGGFQIPELKNTVTKNKQDILDEISKKVATESYNTKVTELERLISANAKGISLAAVKTEVYTRTESDGRYADKAYVERQAARIDLTEKAITSTVQKGDIISSINQTAEQITIDVSKLNINADTVVKWLTAKGINADVIKISGDKVTIDKNGITVKMANFLYEDEFGKKYSVMPKKNLIADHMFSSISCYLPTNNMRRIKHSPEWRITGEPYIEDNYTDFGYEQMINAMRINIQHWIRYPLFSGVKRGKKYTLSAHFRTATYNGNVVSDYPRLRVITGHFASDGRPVEDLRFEKAYDAPGRNIVRYSNTFTIPDNFPDNGFCYFDIYGAGDYGSNMAVCVSGVQLVEGDLPSVYNWDTTIDNLASGYTPVQSLSIGNRDTFLGYGVTSPEFRISTNADVHFNRKISTYGVNVGGQPFGAYGSIFYANGASGWSFYTMGIDGNWKTWNGI